MEKKEEKTYLNKTITLSRNQAKKILIKLLTNVEKEKERAKFTSWIEDNKRDNQVPHGLIKKLTGMTGFSKSIPSDLIDLVTEKNGKSDHSLRKKTKKRLEKLLCPNSSLEKWFETDSPKHYFFNSKWIGYYPSKNPITKKRVVVITNFSFDYKGALRVVNPVVKKSEGRWLFNYNGEILSNSSDTELHLALKILGEDEKVDINNTIYIIFSTGQIKSSDNLPKVMVGSFLRRDIDASISSGVIVFEQVDKFDSDNCPKWYTSHYEDSDKLSTNHKLISDFFYHRGTSFARTPTKRITDIRGIHDEVIKRRDQRFRRDPRYFDIYIASPIGINIDKSKENQIKAGITELIKFLNHGRIKIYSEDHDKSKMNVSEPFSRIENYEDYNNPEEKTDLQITLRRLFHTRLFVLYAPFGIGNSSCIVEAGFARANKIPAIYFVANPKELPTFLCRPEESYPKYICDITKSPFARYQESVSWKKMKSDMKNGGIEIS